MADDRFLSAAAGWCTPDDILYEMATQSSAPLTLPNIAMPPRPGTPEWEAWQQELVVRRHQANGLQELVHRVVGETAYAQERAIQRAQYDAEFLGLRLHVHLPPHDHEAGWARYATRWSDDGKAAYWQPYRFIGISLEEPTPYDTHQTRSDYPDWDDE